MVTNLDLTVPRLLDKIRRYMFSKLINIHACRNATAISVRVQMNLLDLIAIYGRNRGGINYEN